MRRRHHREIYGTLGTMDDYPKTRLSREEWRLLRKIPGTRHYKKRYEIEEEDKS